MEENRHELNNFLRKKLNQMDDSSSNWDQPNPEIWQDTKALLRKGKAKIWYLPNKKWAMAASFALLALVSYACFLQIRVFRLQQLKQEHIVIQDQLKQTKDQLDTALLDLSQVKNELIQIQRMHTNELVVPIESDAEQVPIPPSSTINPPDIRPIQTSSTITSTLHQKILPIDIKNTLEQESVTTNQLDYFKRISLPPIPTLDWSLLEQDYQPIIINNESNLVQNTIQVKRFNWPDFKIEMMHKRGEHALIRETSINYTDNEDILDIEPLLFNQSSYGLLGSVSISDRLTLNTGLNIGQVGGDWNDDWELLVGEDDIYEDLNGNELFDIEHIHGSRWNLLYNQFTYQNIGGHDTDEDQFFLFDLYETYQFKTVQIPVQLEYYYPINNLKLSGLLGYQWNRITLEDYFAEPDLLHFGHDWNLNASELLVEEEEAYMGTSYSNIQVGLGLHIDLTNHWGLSTRLLFENQDVYDTFSLGLATWNQSIQFGLYYTM